MCRTSSGSGSGALPSYASHCNVDAGRCRRKDLAGPDGVVHGRIAQTTAKRQIGDRPLPVRQQAQQPGPADPPLLEAGGPAVQGSASRRATSPSSNSLLTLACGRTSPGRSHRTPGFRSIGEEIVGKEPVHVVFGVVQRSRMGCTRLEGVVGTIWEEAMPARVVINGLGRIGRATLKAVLDGAGARVGGRQRRAASLVDLTLTAVTAGDLVKIMAWYDNEGGYVRQMVRHALATVSEPAPSG